MISRIVRENLNTMAAHRTDKNLGDGRTGMRMASQRSVVAQILNIAHLPVDDSEDTAAPVQDNAGNFLFLDGYSAPGGPDI